jgi:hypothetical protein
MAMTKVWHMLERLTAHTLAAVLLSWVATYMTSHSSAKVRKVCQKLAS